MMNLQVFMEKTLRIKTCTCQIAARIWQVWRKTGNFPRSLPQLYHNCCDNRISRRALASLVQISKHLKSDISQLRPLQIEHPNLLWHEPGRRFGPLRAGPYR